MKKYLFNLRNSILLLTATQAFAATPMDIPLESLYRHLDAPHQALVAEIFSQLSMRAEEIASDPKQIATLLSRLERAQNNFWSNEVADQVVDFVRHWSTIKAAPEWNTGNDASRLQLVVARVMNMQLESGRPRAEVEALLHSLSYKSQGCAGALGAADGKLGDK